jgi:alpha-amylase
MHLNLIEMRALSIAFALLMSCGIAAQTTVKKVVLQAFWWDYYNSNYHDDWANYLADLAPRLKAMGIDAIWIPPASKNESPGYVGYAPFDHYDLGDKFQKGATQTRLGTKDEYLRMIAILHANGIEVIQDLVLNQKQDLLIPVLLNLLHTLMEKL